MAEKRLAQVVAVEKTVKSKTNSETAALNKAAQKPELFNGFVRIYKPLNEEGEAHPPEASRVQYTAPDVLRHAALEFGALWDVEATLNAGNAAATADVHVDGQVVITDVPAATLLFLEKQLDDWRTFVDKLPVLDPAKEWHIDGETGLYRSDVQRTRSTKKVQKGIVLYDATEKHPAQTQLITEDETVGHWERTDLSGAIPSAKRRALLDRADKLRKALKEARESANTTKIQEQQIANPLMSYLLAETLA